MLRSLQFSNEHDINNKVACAPSEDSDQPAHPRSLTGVFAVRSVGTLVPNVSSCGQRRLDGCPNVVLLVLLCCVSNVVLVSTKRLMHACLHIFISGSSVVLSQPLSQSEKGIFVFALLNLELSI